MSAEGLVTDLAVILVIASLVSFFFHKVRQPVVLGYIIAGVIVGPYKPPFSLISEPDTIGALAEVGVILLLFGIGLGLPIRKLRTVGRVSAVVASIEISLMIVLSLIVGRLIGWNFVDSIFLGVALASSSTTIIAKVLSDMNLLEKTSATIMLGVLVIEDLVVVLMLAVLQSSVTLGSFPIETIILVTGKIVLFAIGAVVIGWKLITPFVRRILLIKNDELTVITIVGLCCAFSIAASLLGFSVAIGAFIGGVVIANIKGSENIANLIRPLKNIFGAIFFISVGALMDITKFSDFLEPALIITLTLVVAKFFGCNIGTRLSGYDNHVASEVGLGMAQVGEFAFIVVKVGNDLNVVSGTLFSTVGVVAIITTFLTPYLIKMSHKRNP
jgi:CPA2 family monovalent cation:H+ antiporter-2